MQRREFSLALFASSTGLAACGKEPNLSFQPGQTQTPNGSPQPPPQPSAADNPPVTAPAATPRGGGGDQTAELQAAIDSGQPVVELWRSGGDISFGGTLFIDRAIRFEGSGASDVGVGHTGPSTTRLLYTGTGNAIQVVGSTDNGKENIHLSDFLLVGTANASNGIVWGSGTNVVQSSIRNVGITGFTGTGAAGLKIRNSVMCEHRNLLIARNYDGLVCADGNPTTQQFFLCRFYNNGRYGVLLNALSGSAFYGCDFESNESDGLHVDAQVAAGSIDIFNPHFEANNLSLGTAPIFISSGGAGSVTNMQFWGGVCSGQVDGRSIDLDHCSNIVFNHMQVDSILAGFIRATANTTHCVFKQIGTGWGTTQANVQGNTIDGVIVPAAVNTDGYCRTLASGSEVFFPHASGMLVVTDRTHNKTALIAINGSSRRCTIIADPDAGFSVTAAANDDRVHFYYSSGYRIYNGHRANVNLVGQILMAGQPSGSHG